MCGGRAGPGGAPRLCSCPACGGNLGFPRAGASSLPPSQRFARLLTLLTPHLALSRYGQVSGSLADAGGVVGILGPGPFKVRGARFHSGPSRSRSVPGQGPRHSPARLGHHQPQSRIGDKERFLCQWRRSLIWKRRAGRDWDTGLVTHPSLCKLLLLTGVALDSFLPSFFPSRLSSCFFFLSSFLYSFILFPLLFIFVSSAVSLCPVFYLYLLSSTTLPSGGPRASSGRAWRGVLFSSGRSSRNLVRKNSRGRLSRAVDLGLVCRCADKASVTITTGWRRPCVPPPRVSSNSIGDPICGHSRRFRVPAPRARRASPALLGA